MHLAMPWFFPLATLVAWFGFHTTREARAEGPSGRSTARWLRALMLTPLIFWLLAQFTSNLGVF